MNIFKLVGTVGINRAQAVKDINVIKKTAEGASTAMGRSFTKFTGYVKAHSAQIKAAGKTLTILGGIATAAFAVSVKSAAKFEEELANVSTMLDKSAMKILPQYRDGLQDLSMEFGEATDTLSKGLYDILSASIDPAKALDVLAVAAKAASAGITDTGVAADAITTVINSYGLEAEDAAMVSDKLFAIVKRGKTTFGELAPAIGRVAATAAKSGLSFDELGATIATCTRAGVSTNETMTSIAGVLKTFLTPQTEAADLAWDEFGLRLDTTTLKTIGLTGVMDKLKDASAEQLATIFGNIRGLKGMMAALGDAEGYAKDYALMLESAGLTQEAFEKQSDTLNFQLGVLKQTFNVVKVMIGDALIPTIKKATEWITKTVLKVKDWIKENRPLFEILVKVGAGLAGVMLVLGPMLIILPGLIASLGLLKIAFLPFIIGGLIVVGLIKVNSLLDEMNKKAYEAQMAFDSISVAEIDKELEALAQEIKRLEEQIKINSKLPLFTSAQHGSLIDIENSIRNLKMKMGLLIKKREELTKAEKEGIDVAEETVELDKEIAKIKKEIAEAMEKEAEAREAEAKMTELLNKQKEITNKIYELEHNAMEVAIRDLDLLKEAYLKEGLSVEEVSKWYALEIEKLEKLNPLYVAAIQAKEDLTTAMEGVNRTIFEFTASGYDVALQDINDKYDALEKQVKEAEIALKEEKKALDQINKARKLEIEQIVKAEYERKKSKWVEYLKKVANSWSDLQIKMSGLGPVLDELGIKWRDVEKEAVEAAQTSEEAWSEFFTNLKNKYTDTIGAIQGAITSFVSTFQGAIKTVLTDLWHMKEINDQILQEMAETEQEWADEKEKVNEEYKQALIKKLEEYVDAKDLQNMSIAELEILANKNSVEGYEQMSLDVTKELAKIDEKYSDILDSMEGEQVTFASIMKSFWKTLVNAIITELARLAAYYIVMWIISIISGIFYRQVAGIA